jgi:hypothetical protein
VLPGGAVPEKRKVGGSTPPLTTSPERGVHALSRESMRYCGGLGRLIFARSRPLVTAGRRTLVHAECT